MMSNLYIPFRTRTTGLLYCAENRAMYPRGSEGAEIVLMEDGPCRDCALTGGSRIPLYRGRPAAGQHSARDIFKDSDPGHADQLYDYTLTRNYRNIFGGKRSQ